MRPLTFRIAQSGDLPRIIEMAEAPDDAEAGRGRALLLEQAVLELRCWLAVEEDVPVGFGVISHTFFGRPFVELLVVHPAHRQRGVGRALVRHLTSAAGGNKPGVRVFTSTNLSNTPMQRLLEGEGFERSGIVENLDEDDPELIYVKFSAPSG